MKVIRQCPICGIDELPVIADLGYLPCVNDAVDEISKVFVDTKVLFCGDCRLGMLNAILDREVLFPASYPYTSGSTNALLANFKDLEESVGALIELTDKSLVIDLGSNDGSLLSFFQHKSRVLGVTPENAAEIANQKGIQTIQEYYTAELATRIVSDHGLADVICCTNMFAHIDDPRGVARSIKGMLKKNGLFVVEVHYIGSILTGLQYDTIYHEHLRYYSIRSLRKLLELEGFSVLNVQKISSHGGSIRMISSIDHLADRSANKVNVYESLINEEDRIFTPRFEQRFQFGIYAHKLSLLRTLIQYKEKGFSVFGIGAPSRATTLINFVGIGRDLVTAVFENNQSQKIGMVIPGTSIPIRLEPDSIQEPCCLLILSWHLGEGFYRKIQSKFPLAKLIIPLPTVFEYDS